MEIDNRQDSAARPLVITMGCPAGIGPEIILKAWAGLNRMGLPCPLVVAGDTGILERAMDFTGTRDMKLQPWQPGTPLPGTDDETVMHIWPVTEFSPDEIELGRPTSSTGKASFAYVKAAIDLCLKGQAAGMVTAPISKTGLKMAGLQYPGHTEILAEKTGTREFLMMMAGKRLNVTLVTIHVPLSQVPSMLTLQRILRTVEITSRALEQDFGMQRPRIAVCGLNPHAGEDGMFGTEEIEIIAPACKAARDKGLDVTGPLPPDTVFYRAATGDFDAVVCQYHDQGLIPFKLLHFEDGVNVTLGLPIIRTSVDHGTAYDIAGTGQAGSSSLEAAVAMASRIAVNRAACITK